jgi:hypothetical protein
VKAVDAHTFTKAKKKFKQTLSSRKLTATVFWDRKGVLMVEFIEQGATITSEIHRTRGNNNIRNVPQNTKNNMHSHSEQKVWNADTWC